MVTTFEHRHSLSIDAFSLEECNTIITQLAQIDQPTEATYYSHSFCFSRAATDSGPYRLCYYYDRISLELLAVLASLRTRYTLHNTVTHEDALRFWPDYLAPQGVLAALL
jgi:hypothetical protein